MYNISVYRGFYELYCHNQHIADVYRHFKDVLTSYGFDVEVIGDVKKPVKIPKALKEEMAQLAVNHADDLVAEYIISENKTHDKFVDIHTRATFLGPHHRGTAR